MKSEYRFDLIVLLQYVYAQNLVFRCANKLPVCKNRSDIIPSPQSFSVFEAGSRGRHLIRVTPSSEQRYKPIRLHMPSSAPPPRWELTWEAQHHVRPVLQEQGFADWERDLGVAYVEHPLWFEAAYLDLIED